MTDKRREAPWFGYAPAENPTSVTDVLFDVVGDYGFGVIDDETWMDVIVEGVFDSSIHRRYHGTKSGAGRGCKCFLCLAWKAESNRRKVTIKEALPLEDSRHPIHRKGPKVR